MPENRQNRVLWLDSCKGFAMIIVVIGHIMSGYRSAGLFMEEQHIITTIYNLIYSFHMGVFFCISGAVFYIAYISRREERKNKFVIQTINLVIVYFLFSILQWGFKMIMSPLVNEKPSVRDLVMMPVSPMSPYWYLWDLAFFYLLFYKLYERRYKDSTLAVISALAGFVGSFIYLGGYNVRSCLFYMFLFWLGTYLAKTEYHMLGDKRVMMICVCVLGITAYAVLTGIADIRNVPVLSLVSACGITYVFLGAFSVVGRKWTLKVLNIIGCHSLEIYVTHCFITAANRKLLIKIGITDFYINVLVNAAMAIVIPLSGVYILKKFSLHKPIFRPATWWHERRGHHTAGVK